MCVRALLPLIRPRSARLYIIHRSYCSPLSQTSLLAVQLKIRLFLLLLFSLTRHLTVPLFTVKNFSPSRTALTHAVLLLLFTRTGVNALSVRRYCSCGRLFRRITHTAVHFALSSQQSVYSLSTLTCMINKPTALGSFHMMKVVV